MTAAALSRRANAALLSLAALALLVLAPLAPARAQQATFAPPGQVLEIELNEGQLIRLDKPANSVFVANPKVADISVKSERLLYVFGTGTGETNLYAVDEKDNIVANIKLVVAHNVSRLNNALNQLAPGSGMNAESLDGGIVLTGATLNATTSENARRLATRFLGENEEVINRLAVTSPNQINLRVRIAEVSRQVIEQFGINWESVFTGAQDFLFGLATGSPVLAASQVGTTATTSPTQGTNSFITRNGLEGSNAYFRSTKGNFEINMLIDLLAQNGLVSILAEPNLTALSGETASFLAGGEFPIPVPQRNGNVTIEFKKYGVSLAFTPTLIGDNRISMKVRPEVSQLTNAGAVTIQNYLIPGLTTRRAETTIELGSGQSFAIAGLLLDNSQQDKEKIPGLSDIPVLGALFDSDRFERNESELVIIATPYIVKAIDRPEDISLPTDPYVKREPTAQQREAALAPPAGTEEPLTLGALGGASGGPTALNGFILE